MFDFHDYGRKGSHEISLLQTKEFLLMVSRNNVRCAVEALTKRTSHTVEKQLNF